MNFKDKAIILFQERLIHMKAHLKSFMAAHIYREKGDGHPALFVAILLISSACLFILSAKTAEPKAVPDTQAKMQLQLINFAGFILDIPGEEPNARYQQAVRNLVLDSPEVLRKLQLKDIGHLFDKISLTRQVGDSHMWQFASKNCVLDIYFVYREGENLEQRPIEYYDIRSVSRQPLVKVFAGQGPPISNKQAMSMCLKTIVRERSQHDDNPDMKTASLDRR